jgi:NAD(P)-dependent dehydrogenase (short-subunit alcohol dehydrogenase family)
LGAEIVVHGRDSARGADAVRAIGASGGKARFIPADLMNVDEVRRLARDAGPVDILINNAAWHGSGATVETDEATFDAHVSINLRAPFFLVQDLAPGMASRGSGVIVNVSTFTASVAGRGCGVYGASKAGLELLTLIWADEFGPLGVRVNAVAAGPMRSDGHIRADGVTTRVAVAERLGRAMSLGRMAEAVEIANVVVFLCSADASYINGAVLQAHGGLKAVGA